MQWNPEITKRLEELLSTPNHEKTAVFDADGTLWPDDLGEAFFKYQIQFDLAPGLKGMKSPWEYYSRLDRVSTSDANAWLTKLNSGLPLKELREQAKRFYESTFRKKLNPLMVDLIKKMKERHFDIWICTASMRWAIEPVLYDLDLPMDRLIGTECEIDSKGRLTQIIKTPIPYADGKKRALDIALNGKLPTFVAGNSSGDTHMLQVATVMPLVVQYFPVRPEIAGSELSLRQEAENMGWPIQLFKE